MSPQHVLSAALASVFVSSASAGVVDGGFEAPTVPNWTFFVGGAVGGSASEATTQPRNGLQHAEFSISGSANSFAGVFQDVFGLIAGDVIEFSGWHSAGSDPLDVDVEIRIEWRDLLNNTEVGRTPNLTPTPGSSYSQWALPGTVPSGAAVARIVYAIQTFTTTGADSGVVRLDDVSMRAIPLPATLALALLGLPALLWGRRIARAA